MPNFNEKTSRGWPLPHPDNDLEHEVERLRASFRAIDKALDVIEGHLEPLEENQNLLETRLDVIAEQTTEDTEILDARVDAESTEHPNLGHNVRSLHSQIISLNEDMKYAASEHQGILKQLNELAEARI